MSAIDDPKTLGRARLSFADQHDIDEFIGTLEKFERGEIGPDQWRAFRLVRGTYGQRQDGDFHMLRVKVPQGVLDARQLYALATVAETYSRGFGHITTRQNIQLHFLKLHDVPLAIQLLADVGVTTREACGNSVRNITCCPYAGVSPSELFDVTPFAEALTRYFLRHPLSSSLPRKFQDRLRRVPRGPRRHRHPRHRAQGADTRDERCGRTWVPDHRRWRHRDYVPVGQPAPRVCAGR